MAIVGIDESMWDGILRLQSEVYHQIEPESLATLKSKWTSTPSCCFVYRSEGKVLAYLLAHAWDSQVPPKLFQPLPSTTHGRYLFLHDLSVSRQLSGFGVGTKMVNHLLDVAKAEGFEEISLVAIQNSVPFWSRMGFQVVANQKACSSYGGNASVMRRVL